MNEILPGVWHWTAEHPGIHQTVSSYYVEDGGALIDPLLPKEGLGVLGDFKAERVILSCRHHGRSTARIAAMTRARVHVPAAGARHFHEADFNVVPYGPGDELTPSVTAHAMAAISPDDAVLHISVPTHPGILHFADGLLVRDGELSFMPDSLMDDPHAVRRATLARLDALLSLPFDALTFAHSEPILEGGHAQLAEFVKTLRP